MSHPTNKILAIAGAALGSAAGAALLAVYFGHLSTNFLAQTAPVDYSRLTTPHSIGPADGPVPATPRAPKAAVVTPMPQVVVLPGMIPTANLLKPLVGGSASYALNPVSVPSVAQGGAIASISKGIAAPPLELQRQREEKTAGNAGQTNITIETGFECSPKMAVRELSPTHFALEVPTPQWFMFSVHGVAGKTVRFDIVNPGIGLKNWASLNPVCTYATDVDDPATYATDENTEGATGTGEERAWNGAALPLTAKQKWHFAASAWMEDVHRFSIVQHFDRGDAVIAMRVPYTPGYSERELRQIASTGKAQLVEMGRSYENRPLLMLVFSEGEEARRTRPCILIYAGEHSDEHDAMWAASGAAGFCAADTPEARDLRSRFTILVLPCLDPDAAARGDHFGMILSFGMGNRTGESIQYANWFQKWVIAGNRLDVVLDLHNIQSMEGPEIAPALLEGVGERGVLAGSLNSSIIGVLAARGFANSRNAGAGRRGWSPSRLGGWLTHQFGPLTLAYELNSQSAMEHLPMRRVAFIGNELLAGFAGFIGSADGSALLNEVDARRAKRLERWAVAPAAPDDGDDPDALQQEAASWQHAAAADVKQTSLEKWVP